MSRRISGDAKMLLMSQCFVWLFGHQKNSLDLISAFLLHCVMTITEMKGDKRMCSVCFCRKIGAQLWVISGIVIVKRTGWDRVVFGRLASDGHHLRDHSHIFLPVWQTCKISQRKQCFVFNTDEEVELNKRRAPFQIYNRLVYIEGGSTVCSSVVLGPVCLVSALKRLENWKCLRCGAVFFTGPYGLFRSAFSQDSCEPYLLSLFSWKVTNDLFWQQFEIKEVQRYHKEVHFTTSHMVSIYLL